MSDEAIKKDECRLYAVSMQDRKDLSEKNIQPTVMLKSKQSEDKW